MRNVLVNFSKKAVDNISSVMGAGADLDIYGTITELNHSLNHGSSYDKALLWHTYPGDEDPQIMAEYAEELEELAQLLGRAADAPEVWVMEKTREACAYDYERLSNVSDLIIIHIASMGGIGPVLQSALGSTISAIKVSKSLVGLYGEAEYNEDAKEFGSNFEDDDGDFFDGAEVDEFEDAEDFADDDESVSFDDTGEDEFTDAEEPDFEDGFETEDDEFVDSGVSDGVVGAVSEPKVAVADAEEADFTDEFDDAGADEFGDAEADEFRDAEADEFDGATENKSADFEDEFEPTKAASGADIEDEFDGDFTDASEPEEQVPFMEAGGAVPEIAPVAADEVDEFDGGAAPEDFDDFEEAPQTAPAAEAEPEAVAQPVESDEFVAAKAAPVAPVPVAVPTVPEQGKKKKVFGKKSKAVVAEPAPKAAPAVDDEADVAAVENAELSKSALSVLKSVCAKRCCQLTVTGEHCSGKSTVAMNIGNVLAKHFRVLVVDMDGETRGISYMHNDIIQNVPIEDTGMRSIFSAGLNSGNKPFVVKKNLAVSTMGLASDTFSTNEAFSMNNVTRAHNQLMHSFDFIIYDMPLEAALDKLTPFITTSYILYCVEANNYGFMNLLFRIGNIEDSAVAQQLVENAVIVPTKSSGYANVGNLPVKNTKQALRAVQSIGNELVGGECELDFASMDFAAALPYSPKVQQMVGSKHFYSDTGKGFQEYSKLIASVFGL